MQVDLCLNLEMGSLSKACLFCFKWLKNMDLVKFSGQKSA